MQYWCYDDNLDDDDDDFDDDDHDVLNCWVGERSKWFPPVQRSMHQNIHLKNFDDHDSPNLKTSDSTPEHDKSLHLEKFSKRKDS